MSTQKLPRPRREQLLRDLYQISLTIAVLKHVLSAGNNAFVFAAEALPRTEIAPYLKG